MNETEKKAYDTIPEDQRKKMHRIVTIVDEAKDLFNKEVNPNAAKLFGMVDHMLTVARSVGAHMVIASQSPAKQNIPGKIQANIGAKMTFRLQNKNDAENIGVPDATDLLMYGDGYFEDPFSGAKPTRLQTGFIDKSDAAKINEKTKGDQKFIEKAPKKVMPKYEPTTESTSDFKLKTEETRKRLDEQRKRIQEDIANLERKRIQQDQTESENRQKRETSDQKRRELAQQQGDIESKKDLTPETIEPSTETTTDVAEPETADDDLQRQIDELTVEKPVDEVKKQMQKPKEEKLEEKPVQERKKGLLDRIKKFIGK